MCNCKDIVLNMPEEELASAINVIIVSIQIKIILDELRFPSWNFIISDSSAND